MVYHKHKNSTIIVSDLLCHNLVFTMCLPHARCTSRCSIVFALLPTAIFRILGATMYTLALWIVIIYIEYIVTGVCKSLL